MKELFFQKSKTIKWYYLTIIVIYFSLNLYSQNPQDTVLKNQQLMHLFNNAINIVDSVGISYFSGWSGGQIGYGFQIHYRHNKNRDIIYSYMYFFDSETIRVTKGGFKAFFEDYGFTNNYNDDYIFIYLIKKDGNITIQGMNNETNLELLDTIPLLDVNIYFTKANPFSIAKDFYIVSSKIGGSWNFKNQEEYFIVNFFYSYRLLFFPENIIPDSQIKDNCMYLKNNCYLQILNY